MRDARMDADYSESENCEVLLLRRVVYDSTQGITQLRLLDGSTLALPIQRHRIDRQAWKVLTAQLMQQQVPVRAADAPLPIARSRLEALGFGHCFYLGSKDWEEDCSTLRLCLVDEAGELQGLDGATVHDRYRLEYRNDLGYRRIKPLS